MGIAEPELSWDLPREADRRRWWVRDLLYTTEPRTPLSDSVTTPQWDEAVLCIADDLKFPDSRGFNARTVNGYTYLSPMPITDPKVIEARVPQFFARIAALTRDVEADLARYRVEQEADEAFWRTIDFTAIANPMSLLETWRRALASLDRAWKLHFLIVFPRHVVGGMVDHHARDWAGLAEAHEIGKLTQAHGPTRQLELDQGLWRLAGRALELGLGALFLGTDEASLEAALAEAPTGRLWLDELHGLLDRYGHRTVLPLELSDRSWREDPRPVLGTIRAYVAQGGHFDFEALEAGLEEGREVALAAALARIADPDRRRDFSAQALSARLFQAAMEDDNFHFLKANVRVRYAALEIGRRLAEGGALDSADDVFFLGRSELEGALVDLATGMYALDGYREAAKAARALWDRWRQAKPPAFLGDLPETIDDFMLNHFWGIRGRAQLMADGASVSGLGASAGIVEGTARLVVGPEAFGRVEPGEIVVCRATNPAWTPLFTKIGGIVTDQGGTLSHAAVVAREYGIPAVLGTITGTARIPDGARIRLDGAAGRVDLL